MVVKPILFVAAISAISAVSYKVYEWWTSKPEMAKAECHSCSARNQEEEEEEAKRWRDRLNRLKVDEGMTIEEEYVSPDGNIKKVKCSISAKYLDRLFTKTNTNATTTLDADECLAEIELDGESGLQQASRNFDASHEMKEFVSTIISDAGKYQEIQQVIICEASNSEALEEASNCEATKEASESEASDWENV